MKTSTLSVVLLLVACQATTPDSSTIPPKQTASAGVTRHDTEAEQVSSPLERALSGVVLHVRPIATAEAEDGLGGVSRTESPVALDLERSGGWPGRAGDPILSIGALRYTRYSYPTPTTLRYIAQDPGPFEPNVTPISLQFGEDVGSRIVPLVAAC